jgi:predicted DNA-binding transcriptional regulator YafY
MYKNRAVLIRHRKAGSRSETTRRVYPYGLASFRGDWYMVGFCKLRNATRTFAISRITHAERLREKYTVPEDFDLEAYFSRNVFGVMRSEKLYKVRIRFAREAAPYIKERVWPNGQAIHASKDGSVVLSLETSHLDELAGWVLSFGEHARVLSPATLANRVKQSLRSALKVYR